MGPATTRADAALACLVQGPTSRRGRPFSSGLSVDESILLKEIGLEPRGLVVGSAVYHLGYQARSWSANQEMTQLTEVMYAAREHAVTAMRRRAQALGALGVIGLQLDVRMHHGAHPLAEFVALGTAVGVARDGAAQRPGQWPTQPLHDTWTSDLSGQDLYLLARAGYQPAGLVFGACVYHVAHQGLGQLVGRMGRNVELSQYTEALYEARELAMGRMQAEAARQRAQGIVAMRIEQRSHVWGSHVIEFLAIGTAVRLVTAQHRRLEPRLIVSLHDQTVPTVTPAPHPPSEGGTA